MDLSWSEKFGKLPDAICGLYNLYTLDLRGCYALEKLPDNMGKLISLKHLYVGHCDSLKYLPKGIGRLTSLQTLDVCPLFPVDSVGAFQAGDLGSLNQLQGSLRISILGKVKEWSEAQLRDKKQLFHLQLAFGEVREDLESLETSVQIMNVLRPHDDLESLEIYQYHGSTWPNWLVSLNNLRFLTLQYNWGCEILPPLRRLPFLEKLYVRWMGVRKVGGEFLGVEDDDQTSSSFKSSSSILFPKLKQLEFSDMWYWKAWEGMKGGNKVDSGITIMLCLSFLHINACYGLETLPDFLCEIPLQNHTILGCSKLVQHCVKGSGKEWPKISHISNIEI